MILNYMHFQSSTIEQIALYQKKYFPQSKIVTQLTCQCQAEQKQILTMLFV